MLVAGFGLLLAMVWREDGFAYRFTNGASVCPAKTRADLLEKCPSNLTQGDTDPLFRLSSGRG